MNAPTRLSDIMRRKYDEDTIKAVSQSVQVIRAELQEHRNDVVLCPCCKSKIDDVVTSFPKEVVLEILGMAMAYYRKTGLWEFSVQELQDTVGRKLSHTAYANINHFVRFGGIMYRPINPKTGEPYKSSFFGINIDRARAFFKGEYQAPVKETRNRLTGETSYEKASIHEFPSIAAFIDADGFYNPYAL